MNTKYNLIVMGLLVLAIFFVPFVPHDSSESCDQLSGNCDDSIGYVSLYTKYFK